MTEDILFALRLDATLLEWERAKGEPVLVMTGGRCDVCLVARIQPLHRRGHKQICHDCAKVNAPAHYTGNTNSPVPLGDVLYELWDGQKK